jgi:peroxiredoxin Q/BCP
MTRVTRSATKKLLEAQEIPEQKSTKPESKPEEEKKSGAKATSVAKGKNAKSKETSKATSTAGKFAVGDTIPSDITLKDDKGVERNIQEICKAGPAVFFVYPKANTSTCTRQAKLFRDNHDFFKEKGYQVFGISADGQTSQARFVEKQGLTYSLLCDTEHKLLKPLGLKKSAGGPQRSYFIISQDGTLMKCNPANAEQSLEEAKEFVEANPHN